MSKMRLYIIILSIELALFSISNSLCISSQNFERFSNKEGFNQNTINTISQDRYGFLWIGTPNGLIKYDGYEFETYTNQTKGNGNISNNFITNLFNDDSGVLWIGTSVGVDVYIPWLEKFYSVPLESKLEIKSIKPDQNGNIWISGGHKLFTCKLTNIEEGTFKVSENILAKKFNIPQINDFNFIDSNNVILATDNSIKKIDIKNDSINFNPTIKNVFNYEKFNGLNITSVKSIKNIFWIGTQSGLYKTTLENNRIHIIKKIETIGKQRKTAVPLFVNTIFEDKNNDVWIGTTNNGLLKYREIEDDFIRYRNDPKNQFSISSNYINAIHQDNYGVLWIGTAQGGINKLDVSYKQFINYSKNPYDKYTFSDNLITTIFEDNKGKLWVSVFNQDLFRSTTAVNDNTVKHLKFENLKNTFPEINGDFIRHIYEDKKGYLWFVNFHQIIVYNPFKGEYKSLVLKQDGDYLPQQIFFRATQIDDDHILIAGNRLNVLKNPWTKLQSSNPTSIIDVKTSLNLNQERVQALLTDNANNLWIGTTKGLLHTHFDGENIIINYRISDEENEKLKLSYSSVFSLHQDNSGNLWVGTFGGGLNKINLDNSGNPLKIQYYKKDGVFPDDAIYGILQDKTSDLWISTDMGLVKLNLENDQIDIFDVRDGLAQNNFRQSAYYKGKSGYFYFGGLNGLTIFKPENIKLNTIPPKILITSLLIDNKEVKIGEKLNNELILEKSISETESISVSQNKQSLAFKLIVEHSSTPKKNKLAYKLEGFNDTWIEEQSGKTTAIYTNLPSGDYIFKIKAANGDGIWSDDIKSLAVKITPPWYQTWWSYLLFVLIILLIGIGIVIYFVQHEKLKQRLKYEQLDKERIETINQGKFRYFTNISHEFRTPLTLISGPLEHIIESNKDSSNSKYLAIIQKNTKRLLSLVDQLITFRQAEQGFVSLNLNKITLGNFIYPTTEAFENFAIEKNINFFYKVSSPNEEIVIDIEKVERILFNLLSNSFKNTPQHGNIIIEAKVISNLGTKTIEIAVIDDGKGIPAKDLNNIFERFYQLGNKKENISGGGIGLAFCKSLIDLFKGKITVKSKPNVETRFIVSIPSTPIEDYNSKEIDITNKSYIKDWVPLPSEFKSTLLQPKDKEENKHTILIVEDEEDVQLFLSSKLSNRYNILIAKDGNEGLEKLKSQEPELIISDVMMPIMDGFAFCEKVKSAPETCHIPILLLTALGDDENLIKGLEFGADEYLSKPFSFKHLVLRAERLIQNNIKLKEHFSKNTSIPKKDIEISERDKDFLKSIIEAIEKNISDSTFGVEELSSKLGLSSSHFYRRLKQLTGQVPNVYLRNFRLQRAAELFKSNKGYNVAEVMYQIGIESNSYFSTAFKKLHGVSPSEYLKR